MKRTYIFDLFFWFKDLHDNKRKKTKEIRFMKGDNCTPVMKLGTCKMRNETRNETCETERNEMKRNEAYRSKTERNETKRNVTERNKMKRNLSKRNETKRNYTTTLLDFHQIWYIALVHY